HRRTPSRHPNHFTIAPAHPVIPSRAQRLHRRFLRRKPRRVSLHAVRLRITVANFALGKDSPYKAISEALDGVANAGNFSDVDASANDHVISNFRFPIVKLTNRQSTTAGPHDKSSAHRSCAPQP